MKLNAYGKEFNVKPLRTSYCNNSSLAIVLIDEDTHEDFAVLTVNLNYPLGKGMAFVDTNNCDWAEQFIRNNKLGKPTGMTATSGFCTYPLYKFNLKDIEEME